MFRLFCSYYNDNINYDKYYPMFNSGNYLLYFVSVENSINNFNPLYEALKTKFEPEITCIKYVIDDVHGEEPLSKELKEILEVAQISATNLFIGIKDGKEIARFHFCEGLTQYDVLVPGGLTHESKLTKLCELVKNTN